MTQMTMKQLRDEHSEEQQEIGHLIKLAGILVLSFTCAAFGFLGGVASERAAWHAATEGLHHSQESAPVPAPPGSENDPDYQLGGAKTSFRIESNEGGTIILVPREKGPQTP